MSVPAREFNSWLEGAVKYIYENPVDSICFVAINRNGDVMTSYYEANCTDKAIMAHNIQMDATRDMILNNIDDFREALEEGDDTCR